jgi:MFS superfamily sulfate permease-like transporter
MLFVWVLAAGIAAMAIIVVAILGMVWPRFLAWVANLVTIIAGTAVVFAIAFAVTVSGKFLNHWNMGLAALTGDQSGLTAAEKQTLKSIDPERIILERLQGKK